MNYNTAITFKSRKFVSATLISNKGNVKVWIKEKNGHIHVTLNSKVEFNRSKKSAQTSIKGALNQTEVLIVLNWIYVGLTGNTMEERANFLKGLAGTNYAEIFGSRWE